MAREADASAQVVTVRAMICAPAVRVVSLLLVAGCGRSDREAVGDLGGRCYPNHTCNDDLVCNGTDRCVDADPCDGVTCSDHGVCAVAAGRVQCDCDPGYRASALRCLACGEPSCSDDCPGDMVPIPGQPSCIDRYEATIFENADCTGLRYGSVAADFPGGFPVHVESAGCSGVCRGAAALPASADLYACSVAAVRPTAFVSWFQAKRACENSGKHLCRLAEWAVACSGDEARAYPYGNTFVPGACNEMSGGAPGPTLTGAWASCQGAVPGLFDMSGNVWEWADDESSESVCPTRGGGFGSDPTEVSCGFPDVSYCGNIDSAVGIRCCLAR